MRPLHWPGKEYAVIPYAIFLANLAPHNGTPFRVRALSLDPYGFTFRLSMKAARRLEAHIASCGDPVFKTSGLCTDLPDYPITSACPSLTLRFLNYDAYRYDTVTPKRYSIFLEKDSYADDDPASRFYRVFRCEIEDPAYRSSAEKLLSDYSRYIRLKLDGDDASLSKELTGYPAEKEHIFRAHSFEEQKALFSKDLRPDLLWFETIRSIPEKGILLGDPLQYREFLEAHTFSSFMEKRLKSGLPGASYDICEALASSLTIICIGSAFCARLFPARENLSALLKKARDFKLMPFVMLPPMRESMLENRKELLHFLYSYAEEMKLTLGICVNDPGTLLLLREMSFKRIRISKGPLLFRSPRDVRAPWKKMTSDSHAGIYAPCSFSPLPSLLPGSEERPLLQLPYYQMNTAGLCTMYAYFQNGDRGRQTEENDCPEYCSRNVFLYPDHLPMVGRYNTLFGFDRRSLENGKYLKTLLSGTSSCLIFNF